MPAWLQTWPEEIMALLQVVLVVVCALLLRWLLLRLVRRVARRYELPAEIVIIARRTIGFLIGFAALLLVLRVLGVSGAVLWGAFTGFATVAAVAFFALWSVLTNVFCALLILITRPFRLLDHIELVESGDKPGLRGRVIDMNLVYVTLEESHPGGGESVLRVPNSLFFQRATRRWRGEPPPRLEALAGD
ncbi:mechanosensitive ion channel domain-containing protein, partial [Luteimonas sp. SDU101]